MGMMTSTRSMFVLTALVLCWRREASAQDVKEAPPADAGALLKEREAQRYQLNLGLGMQGVGVGTGNAAGGLGSGGAVGGLGVPFVTAGFETRIAGPAWLMIEATGGINTSESGNFEARSWRARLALGVRLEQPIFDFVSVGGYGVALGSVEHASYEEVLDDGSVASDGRGHFSVGGAFGVGMHFRASSFFGIRLGLEMLRAGYTGGADSSAYAELVASPRVALTFSF